MKKQIPLLITFISGLVMIIAIFIPHYPFTKMEKWFTVWFNIIAVFAFILGGGNLIRMHGNKIYKRAEGWGYSLVAIIGFVGMLTIGLLQIGVDGYFQRVDQGWTDKIYWNIIWPLASTMFALLAFFVASASYRAFRAKNVEATILLATAIIILLARTFLGAVLTDWLPDELAFLKIPELANWIMTSPNLAGQRAIMIGIALGIISTSLKIILGIERSYLGSD